MNNVVEGLDVEFINRSTSNDTINILLYLWKHAKEIDILNLYHWGRKTLLLGGIYKLLNKKGKIFVKLDMDKRGLQIVKREPRKKKVLCQIVRMADVVSVESKCIQTELNRLVGGIVYVPNGFFEQEDCVVQTYNKEKILLTVGRLGTWQKATEILLQAFVKIAEIIPDWRLVLVGDVEKDFECYMGEFESKYKELAKRIEFIGAITDRQLLEEYYKRALIFVMPSRTEGFALVLLEAMSKGCYVVGTDMISPIADLVPNNEFGRIVKTDNVDDLAKGIVKACQSVNCNSQKGISERTHAMFRWETICEELCRYLAG